MSSTEEAPLRILHQDDFLIAVDKPPGMPVQPDPTGDASVLGHMAAFIGGLGPVHRLDRPVSGVLLLARDAATLAALHVMFRERRITKVYWAIVEGEVKGTHELVHALRRDGRAHKSRVILDDHDGKIAKLHVRGLATGERYSLLELRPGGGAFHQIRAQLAEWGHPIKGDVKYGARRGERGRDAVARSIALHARSIKFAHPVSKQTLEVMAPPPHGNLWRVMLELAGIKV